MTLLQILDALLSINQIIDNSRERERESILNLDNLTSYLFITSSQNHKTMFSINVDSVSNKTNQVRGYLLLTNSKDKVNY